MGNTLYSPITKSRKRTFSGVDGEGCDAEEDNLNTPKKKKLKCTSKYIYETLFLRGEGSDITIIALGKTWLLHKVYLCQSGYFASMFSGAWRESGLNIIHMHIPDGNINEQALQVALGSLYQDDILMQPAISVNVLAAATLLGLDGLIQQCVDVLKETISAKTVCRYHASSVMYGQQQLANDCIDWLEKNLMIVQSLELLRDISVALMETLVISVDLFVIQVEMDLYSLLKKWLFLLLNVNWTGDVKCLMKDTDSFFRKRGSVNSEAFLSTTPGAPYVTVFLGLRAQHLINDLPSVKILEQDRILPQDWLVAVYRRQWLNMLHVDQGQDTGPNSEAKEAETEINFDEQSLRCGRVLSKEGEYCWRWTGYSFGVDLLLSFSNRLFTLRRNTHNQPCPGAASLQSERHVLFRLTVASFDQLGQTKYLKKSDLKQLCLGKDDDGIIMSIDRHVTFPVRISCNFLVYTPQSDWLLAKLPAESVSKSDAPTTIANESGPTETGDRSADLPAVL